MHAARQPRSWLIFDVSQKMKPPLLLIIVACAVLQSCAVGGSSRPYSVLEAQRLAEVNQEKRITVRGYFFRHFEGSTLEPKRGKASTDGLFVSYRMEKPMLPYFTAEKYFDGKEVIVDGILRKGKLLAAWGNDGDYAGIEILTIKEANKAPEPTTGAVTPRATERSLK